MNAINHGTVVRIIMRLLLPGVLLCVLLSSCEVFNFANSSDDFGITKAHKKWSSRNTQNYTFRNGRSCECFPPYNYTVKVARGKIEEVYFDGKTGFSYESDEMFIRSTRTVNVLFDLLERYRESADKFEVKFHKKHGYSTKTYIDPDIKIADNEINISISGYTPTS